MWCLSIRSSSFHLLLIYGSGLVCLFLGLNLFHPAVRRPRFLCCFILMYTCVDVDDVDRLVFLVFRWLIEYPKYPPWSGLCLVVKISIHSRTVQGSYIMVFLYQAHGSSDGEVWEWSNNVAALSTLGMLPRCSFRVLCVRALPVGLSLTSCSINRSSDIVKLHP